MTAGTPEAAVAGPTAYVTSTFGGGLTPIDTVTNTAGTPIPVSDYPTGVAITPDGTTAYVANRLAGTVTPIDTATDTAGTPIPVGPGPLGVAVTPDGATAYITDVAANTVTPIDTATNTAGTAIPVGAAPAGIAITPDGTTAYTADQYGPSVTPIDIATNTAGTAIPVGSGPHRIAITPDGATAYIVHYGGSVTPFDIATNTPGEPIPAVGGGDGCYGAAVTPDGTTAYATSFYGGDITPIDTATNTPGSHLVIGGGGPFGMAVTPDGTTAYIAMHNTSSVTPFDVATDTFAPTIPLAGFAWDVAVTPDQAPVAALAVDPQIAGTATGFDALGSTVAYGTIATYDWDFGDGTTATTTGPTTTHTYLTAGTYTASVTETSSAGTSTTQVFTGQTMSRNGGPGAVATQTFTVAGGRPDGRIRRGTGSLVGDDIYNTTGVGQTRTGSAPGGQSVTYYASIQNDAPFAERLRLTGTGSTSRFTVRYSNPAGQNITSQVTGGGFRTPVLAPTRSFQVRVVVTVTSAAPRGSSLARTLTAWSTTHTSVRDTVKFVTSRS